MAVATIPEIKTRMVAQAAKFFVDHNNSVGTALPNIPLTIPDANLPALMVVTLEATHDTTTYGAGSFTDTRDFLLQCYVALLADGTEGEAEAKALALIDSMLEFWAVRHKLQLNGKDPLSGIESCVPVSDVGLRQARYPNNLTAPLYALVELRLRVVRKRRIQLMI